MKYIVLIMVIISMTSCAHKMKYSEPPVELNSYGTAQILQAAKVTFMDKEFVLQGVMITESTSKKVRIAALTGFGIKIFEAEYTNGAETFFHINGAFGKIPFFTDAIKNTIKRLYVDMFNGNVTDTDSGQLYNANGWSARINTENNGKRAIVYTNITPSFTVSIKDIDIDDTK